MTRRIRVFLLLALLLAGGGSLVALPPHEAYWEYYTNATYTELCGERWMTCWGIQSWGCRTNYYIYWQGDDC
jgi:hypothetical protein